MPNFEKDMPNFEKDMTNSEKNMPTFEKDLPKFEKDMPNFEKNRPNFEKDMKIPWCMIKFVITKRKNTESRKFPNWFCWHDNPSGVVLCLKVRELRTLYINIYILKVFSLCIFTNTHIILSIPIKHN